jgi:hypothetical protein
MGLGGGLDVPGDQLGAERFGQLLGEHGLAGARFALDQQRRSRVMAALTASFRSSVAT